MSGQTEKKRVSIAEIDRVLENAPGIFNLSDICGKLGHSGDDELLKRLEHLIDGDVNYFHSDNWECELKMHYFSRIPFAITPEKWEIDQGVIFPAGRLTPFLTSEIFPSDAEFIYEDEELPKREITLPFTEALHYSVLIGHEQILDYLDADSPANSGLRRNLSPTTPVTMTVFDCRELFRELRFKEGDALICQLTDPDEGIFEVRYQSAAERSSALRGKWILDFENAMAIVVERFRDYLEIPDQIGWAFYYGGAETANAAASVEEFMSESDRIEIRTDGDHAVLSLYDSSSEPEQGDESSMLPEGLSISSGETSDFGTMLKEIGTDLTPDEIDGFILDSCAARDMNFDRFFARAFPHVQLKYADEAQETVFLNILEERFEEMTEHYNRVGDENKAPLRSTIMELVEDRLEYFADAEHEHDHEHGHNHCKCGEIGAVYGKLNEILRHLNSESFDPSEDELDQLQARVEKLADKLEQCME